MLKSAVLAFFDNNGAAVARAIGVTRSAVNQWPPVIPEAMAYRVQEATQGALKVDATLYRNDLVRTA
jgi:ribosomal protein L14